MEGLSLLPLPSLVIEVLPELRAEGTEREEAQYTTLCSGGGLRGRGTVHNFGVTTQQPGEGAAGGRIGLL